MKRLFGLLLIYSFFILPSFAEETKTIESTDSWILTQYYGGGSVGMFYSIVNPSDDTLILIDGGWTTNAEQVKSVIEENGGYVDYWIITHYHEDHCGAFNALWPKYREKINTILISPLTWEEFEPYCRDWDTPDTFRLYLVKQLILRISRHCIEMTSLRLAV